MTRKESLGFLIRDMIEDRAMQLIDLGDDGEAKTVGSIFIEHVDVSDPENLVVLFEDDTTLTVRILEGPR
jgi:hypothetical protein